MTSKKAGDPDILTLGCRLNTYESEVMRQHARTAGLGEAVIVNTCAVTGEAVRQAKQTIRRISRERPEAKLIVTGCAAQLDPESFAALDGVDHVIGNSDKLRFDTFARLATSDSPKLIVNDIMSVRETAGHLVDGFGNRARAYVQIQNGCDHRCTFCIIPFGRGPSRSVPAGEIVSQIRKLVANGHREVVLTGVDITSYGADLPGQPKLGNLVRRILKLVPELDRLRLSSIDQVEVDDDLFVAMAEEERLMPHLHLSMQSGDDLILKRMKRRHNRSQAIDFCKRLRELRPDVVFGADLIAGFPTEDEAMFGSTLDLVDACDLVYLHIFPFSPREGTPAARMPQVQKAVIKQRSAQLRALGDERLIEFLQGQKGKEISVLMEAKGRGRTPQYAEVDVSGSQGAEDAIEVGHFRKIVVTGVNGRLLKGVLAR